MKLDYLNFLFKSESVFCFACNRVAQLVILRPFTLRQGVYRQKRRGANICARKQKKETKRSVAYRFVDIQFSSRVFISGALGVVENGWAKSCMRVYYSVNESDLLGCMAGSSLRTAREQNVIRATKKTSAAKPSEPCECQLLRVTLPVPVEDTFLVIISVHFGKSRNPYALPDASPPQGRGRGQLHPLSPLVLLCPTMMILMMRRFTLHNAPSSSPDP